MNYVLANLSDEGQLIIDLILILNGCDLNNLTEKILISEEVYNKYFKEKYSQYFISYVSKAADSVPMPQDDAMIERVALAIGGCTKEAFDVSSKWFRDATMRQAREAIAAMQPKAER